MSRHADFVIIGAGIAGASVAAELAPHASVILIERETFPGYHSTGRSAAVFTEIYGNSVIRGLTTASGAFFNAPPDNFSEGSLLRGRPLLMIGREDQIGEIKELSTAASRLVPNIRVLDRKETLEQAPYLRSDYVAGSLLEPDASDLDVNRIHTGFLRAAKAFGAELIADCEVGGMSRRDGTWSLTTGKGKIKGDIVINAAGAWADAVADLAGVARIGLVPKRRSAFIFTIEPEQPTEKWPTTIDISEKFYFKPEAGKLLGSPADETPSEPCDASPEEIDIAIGIDRIMKATDFTVRTVNNRWAGLRSFVADKTPVVGFDADAEGYFWLAAQGGYGIQTSPALSRTAAALALGEEIPVDVAELGVSAVELSPNRLPGRMT